MPERNDADEVLTGLAALPADVRDILAERASKAPDTDETGAPLRDVTTTNRNMTTVYSTMTGEPHEILVIDRPRALRLMRTDGKPAFWAPGMPGRPPKRNIGSLKCFLHPESDEREMVNASGFTDRFCNDGDPSKENRNSFQSYSDKEEHEKRKHPAAYAAVRRYKDIAREQEAHALQVRLVESQIQMAEAIKELAPKPAAKAKTKEE